MIDPTRRRGFSDPIGSWKIIWISRRSGRICRWLYREMSWPSNVIVPDVMSYSRAMDRPSVDLPEPVSPTIPKVCPRLTSKLTPSTACTYSRLSNRPLFLTGKYLTRSCTRSRTSSPVVLKLSSRSPGAGGRGADRRGIQDLSAQVLPRGAVARQPAGRQVPRLVHNRIQAGHLGRAAVHHVRTARRERAAGRRVQQARRGPGNRLQPGPLATVARQGMQQPL